MRYLRSLGGTNSGQNSDALQLCAGFNGLSLKIIPESNNRPIRQQCRNMQPAGWDQFCEGETKNRE